MFMISSAKLTLGRPIKPFSSAKGESASNAGVKGSVSGIMVVWAPPGALLAVDCVVIGV